MRRTYILDSDFAGVDFNVNVGEEYTDSIYFNFTANWLGNVKNENITGFNAIFVHNLTDDFISCLEFLLAWNFSSNQWEMLDKSCLKVGEWQIYGNPNRWRYVAWDSSLNNTVNISNYINTENEVRFCWNSTAPDSYEGGDTHTQLVDLINLDYTFLNPVAEGNFTVSIFNSTRGQFDTPQNLSIITQDCVTSINFAKNVGDYYGVSSNNIQIRLNLTHWAPSAAIAFFDHLYVTINYSRVVTLKWRQNVLDVFESNIYTQQVDTYDNAMENNITFTWDIDSTTLTPGNYSWITICSMGNQIAVNITNIWVKGLPTEITLCEGDGVSVEDGKWVTNPNPYVNDTTRSLRLRVNDTVYGVNLTSITIETPDWPTGQLLVINEFATTGLEDARGYYRVFLNTTGLSNSAVGYNLNLTVVSSIYLDSSVNVTIRVDPLPTALGLTQQTFTVWENESLQIGASFEDTFHHNLITGATLTWELVGGTPSQRGTFDQILYVYDSVVDTLETGIAPGKYTVRLIAEKTDFATSTTDLTLIVLAKNRTVLIPNFSSLPLDILEGAVIPVSATLTYQANSSAVPNEEVEFVFELLTASGQEEVKKKALTDANGLATVDFQIPAGVTSFRISANYAGTETIAKAETAISSTFIIVTKAQQLMNTLIRLSPYIIAAIGAIVAMSLYTRSRHKKAERFWDTRVAKLTDVLNIQHVLVIHKDSGTSILSQSMGSEKLDPNLISGFLTAMTSFQSEIGMKKKETSGKKGIILDYADFKILLEDGEFIRAALILEMDASETTKEALLRFIQRYEARYRKELVSWKGNLNELRGGENLIEDVFEISLVYPHVPNPSINTKKLPRLQRAIYEIAKAITKERPFFFMSLLLEYAFAGRKESKNHIWSVIYDMKKTHLLEPMTVANPSQ
ncbi:MAG: hypothetical protein RBG13Loki_3950 [Promethearchaeota archaeon CR_4]|nr:MAG: hypothetical protein RBG13Loki_3950 [Candidatus Lokiarchaeota archaeon CR_4]